MNSKLVWGIVLLVLGLGLLGYVAYDWNKEKKAKMGLHGGLGLLGLVLLIVGVYLVWKSRQEQYSKDQEKE